MRIGFLVKCAAFQLWIALGVCQATALPCINPPLSPETVAKLVSELPSLVAPGADTRTVEVRVRDLVGTDASLAWDLIRLARVVSPRFRTAIAAGLAQAAVACANIDQEAALLIQQAAASFEDAEFQSSFAAVAGDLSTAATEAALDAASGSSGSVIITNPNGGSGLRSISGGGGGSSIFQITSSNSIAAARSGNTINSTTISTTAASPVSATR